MISDTAARDAYQRRLGWRINSHLREEETMPEMTPDDLARFRHAVQLRDRCVKAAVDRMVYLGDAGDLDDQRAARVAYDAMAELIRTDERDRLAAAGRLLPEGAEQRDEAGVEHTYRDGEPIVLLAASKEAAERTVKAGNERGYAQHRLMQRTSWSTPWSAVPPEPKEGA